jgi:protein-tyrosine-phosphatase
LGEALYRRYTRGLPTTVSSAGTLDLGSLPALREALIAAKHLGIDLSRHRSRSLRQTNLSSADLVLGFEPFHVSAAVADAKAAPDRSFLLGELVALLPVKARAAASVAHARAAVAEASSRRVLAGSDLTALAIRDPLGKSAKVMEGTAADIDRRIQQVVLGLFGSVDESHPRRGWWRRARFSSSAR